MIEVGLIVKKELSYSMLWKANRPFELKPCNDCGEEYKHYERSKLGLCQKCRGKAYHLKHGRMKEEDKNKKKVIKKNIHPA